MRGLSARLSPQFAREPNLPACVSFDAYVQAAACDSMTLLMKKLDQLKDEIQEVQSANPSHSDATKADQEQQSTMVSKGQLNQLKSKLVYGTLN